MKQVHHRCVVLCGLVGFLFTMGPASFENWLVWSLEVDGMKEAYWVCKPHSVPDVNGTSYVSAWDEDAAITTHPELFICSTSESSSGINVWNESDCVYPPGYVSVATIGLICACCRGSDATAAANRTATARGMQAGTTCQTR